jgi:hypothetical protein
MTWRAVAPLVAALLIVPAAAWAAADSAPKPAADVVISDAHGHNLGNSPTLRPDELLEVKVKGFAARAIVTVRLVGRVTSTTTRANAAGMLSIAYVAPTVLGRYRLAVTGRAPDTGGHPGNLVVRVPRVAIIGFRVARGGHGVGGKQGQHGSNGGGGTPSATGVDVLEVLAAGLLAIVAGFALLRLPKRRRG